MLKDFIALVENQFNTTVKIIRKYNGKEFVNRYCSSYLANKGILHQTTCPYTPSQHNGISERKHRNLLEVVWALKFQSTMPDHFWGECILTTAIW